MFWVSVIGGILVPCAPGSTLQIFSSETTFLNAAPIVSTKNFDDISSITHFTEEQIEIDGVFYRNSPTGEVQGWSVTNSVVDAPSKPNVLVSNSLTENQISFGAGQFVQAFGFAMIAGGSSNGETARYRFVIREVNSPGTSFVINWPVGVRYLGLLSEHGIAEITVGPDPTQNFGIFFAFDNVSRSDIVSTMIPEPATFALTVWQCLLVVALTGFRQLRKALPRRTNDWPGSFRLK
jgi:hypothetical protein